MNALSHIPAATTPSAAPNAPAYDARALVRDGQLAQIVLDGQVYVLRITRAGKLILTK